MTSPDGFTPAGAANYDSFAGFANTSEEDWRAQIDGSVTGIDPLEGVCALMSQMPFFDGLASFGGYGDGEEVGLGTGIMNGVQLFADGICGLLTGNFGFSDSTPDSMFGGMSKILDLFFENPFVKLFVELVNKTGNVAFDILNGIMKFFGRLLGFLGGDADSPLGILGVFEDIFGRLFDFFGEAGETLFDLIDMFMGWGGRIFDFAGGIIDRILNLFSGGGRIADLFNGLFDLDGTDGGNGLISTVGNAIGNGLISFIDLITGGSLDDLDGALNNIPIDRILGLPGEFLQNAIGAGVQLLEGVFNGFFGGTNDGLATPDSALGGKGTVAQSPGGLTESSPLPAPTPYTGYTSAASAASAAAAGSNNAANTALQAARRSADSNKGQSGTAFSKVVAFVDYGPAPGGSPVG